MSFSTTSGTVATRFSPGNISRGIPMVSDIVTSKNQLGPASSFRTHRCPAIQPVLCFDRTPCLQCRLCRCGQCIIRTMPAAIIAIRASGFSKSAKVDQGRFHTGASHHHRRRRRISIRPSRDALSENNACIFPANLPAGLNVLNPEPETRSVVGDHRETEGSFIGIAASLTVETGNKPFAFQATFESMR